MKQLNKNVAAVEIRSLSKSFRGCHALKDIDLTIQPGTVYGLIGPNGAGKSTLLRIMMGLVAKTEGEVFLFNRDVFSFRHRILDRVGYVPDTNTMHGWMKVGKVLSFCKTFFKNWDDKMASELLDLFQLDVNKRVKHLSKGMLMKLSLLVACVHRPEILLLDEPLAGLDPIARDEVLEGVLASVCDGDCTVVISSHSLDDVQRITDRLGFLYDGQLILDDKTENLISSVKRGRAVLPDDFTPSPIQENIIYHNVQDREWTFTMRDYTPEVLNRIKTDNQLSEIDVIDLNLEDVFKDVVKGRRQLV